MIPANLVIKRKAEDTQIKFSSESEIGPINGNDPENQKMFRKNLKDNLQNL
jgi:hypothetical protein